MQEKRERVRKEIVLKITQIVYIIIDKRYYTISLRFSDLYR